MIFQKCRNWPQVNNKLIIIPLIFVHITLYAQIDEPTFFNRINTMYYALEETDLKNFSGWLTSNVFEETTKGFYKDEIFPLEVIWIKPNDLYYIRRSLPQVDDSLRNRNAEMAQSDLQKEIQALLLDWSRFYSGKLLAGMPANYVIKTLSDTVVLHFQNTLLCRGMHFLRSPGGVLSH